MKTAILHGLYGSIWTVDAACGALRRRFRPEKPGLICLMFHNPFRDKHQARSRNGAPGEEVTLDEIRQSMRAFTRAGYRFIRPQEAADALNRRERSVLLSFDDGYFNCTHLLPVLDAFAAPAIVFAVTRPVLEQKAFWWDATWRGEFRAGGTARAAAAIVEEMKSWPYERIERRICERYGKDAFAICDDAFRPCTMAELRALAAHPLITLGNHTREHVALDTCDAVECERQIAEGQRDLETLTGKPAVCMAYPYGRFTARTVQVARQHGLELAVTCREAKNLPGLTDLLELRRFNPQGYWNVAIQCSRYRTDNSITPFLVRLLLRGLTLRKRLQ